MTNNPIKASRLNLDKMTAKSWIAVILITVSLLLMIFPWIGISFELLGRSYSLPELVDLICTYNDITEAEFKLELQSELMEVASDLADDGFNLNAKEAMKNVEKILDGGLSPLDMASVCSYFSGILDQIEKGLSLNYSSLSASERQAALMIGDAKSSVTFAAAFFWGVIILTVAAFAYAVYCLLGDKKSGLLIYTGLLLASIIVYVIVVSNANKVLQSYASISNSILEDVFWAIGMRYSSDINLEIFSLTWAPFVCLLFSLAACVIYLKKTKNGAAFAQAIPKISTMPIGKWICNCGAQNGIGTTFCSACGRKRPEKPRCSCGAELAAGAIFCGKCGKRVDNDLQP